MRLLLADDSIEIRNTLSDYLSFFCEGLDITEVSNGSEALEAFNSSEFDIIITDEMMPLMRGSQFIEKVYSAIKEKGILTIVFSGQLKEDLKDRFVDKTEIKVIDKISNPSILKNMIDEHIECLNAA